MNERTKDTAKFMRLYESRESAKYLCGEKYMEKIEPYIHMLREVMKVNSTDEIPALLKISRTQHYKQSRLTQTMYRAAVVEMIEPSK